MNTDDLNKYILNYLRNDKTHSAIMLNGKWGTGKSYYINNTLIPFINDEQTRYLNGEEISKLKTLNYCIVVSLYGVQSLKDLSRNIYIESRFRKILENNIDKNKIVGKTIIKEISSFVGVELDISNEDLSKIYGCINLSNKLLIIEDLERSSLNIAEVLGYINSLVEQDDVKVLLIANEDEIIKKEREKDVISTGLFGSIAKTAGQKQVFTEKTLEYLKVKEKTVSDTISFESLLEKTIHSILSNYKNLKDFETDEKLHEIKTLMNNLNCCNLRSFVYACQKTSEIFSKFSKEYEKDFYECIFYGNIYYSIKKKSNESLEWKDIDNYFTLNNKIYVFFKFCYDYFVKHYFNEEEIEPAINTLKEKRLFDTRKVYDDADLKEIKNFECSTDSKLKTATKNIEFKLRNNAIPYNYYGDIIGNLLSIKYYANCDVDISKCADQIILNLGGLNNNSINFDFIFDYTFDFDDQKIKDKYNEFKDKALKVFQKNEFIFTFDYNVSSIDYFYDKLKNDNYNIIKQYGFFKNMDPKKVYSMFFKSSADKMSKIRDIFKFVYSLKNIKEYCLDDKENLIKLKDSIASFGALNLSDKIQQLQKKMFLNDLEKYIKLLS